MTYRRDCTGSKAGGGPTGTGSGERLAGCEITGYTVACPKALGYPVTAFVRLKYPLGNYKPLHDLLDTTPEIIGAHHVTADDCFIFKLLARSMSDLERLVGKLAGLGSITTSVVYSSPLARRALVPPS